MKGLRLYKCEKLRSRTAVGNLFAGGGHATIAYPLRAVYTFDTMHSKVPAQFLITIPKKKMRHAVDRVLLRRRTREAYRLNRNLLIPTLQEMGMTVDIAFIYLSNEIAPYEVIETKMQELLRRIGRDAHKASAHENDVE